MSRAKYRVGTESSEETDTVSVPTMNVIHIHYNNRHPPMNMQLCEFTDRVIGVCGQQCVRGYESWVGVEI
jgi:hypothetical protein